MITWMGGCRPHSAGVLGGDRLPVDGPAWRPMPGQASMWFMWSLWLLVRRFAANAVCRRHVCAAIAAARHTIMLSPLHACRLTRLDLRNNCFEHLPPALSPTCSSCR